MGVAVPARQAAVRGLALVVVLDRARDPAAPLAADPSRAAAPSPRMDPNRRLSRPALAPPNVTPSQSPVPVHRSEMSPAPVRDPNRTADLSRTTRSPVPVLHGIPARVRAPGHIRKTTETSLVLCRPKTTTTRPIGTTIATKIRSGIVLLIGKVQNFYV